MDKTPGSVGAKNRKRWPLDLDRRDPEGIADFCLGLGYDTDNVVNALVQRCNLDRITARSIVNTVLKSQQGGQ